MSPEQRHFDFLALANLYAKNYAPYEWKRDAVHFDLYGIKPWLDRIRAAKDDLEYFEIASQYVASLRDSHSAYYLPSNFFASAGLAADIYDGKVLIDSITRARLPQADYPFAIGDEIVAVDGQTPEELIAKFLPFIGAGDERARRRLAVAYFFSRPQQSLPRAHEIGDSVSIDVLRPSGERQTYTLPWLKSGRPLTASGVVPTPRASAGFPRKDAGAMPFLEAIQNKRAAQVERVLGVGSRAPLYRLPDGFQQRLGTQASHFHFSGTYTAQGRRIGLLRIPHFSPPSIGVALGELAAEIAFLQQNTDGLVLDITRNPGGSCYAEFAWEYLIHYPFTVPGDEFRATLDLQAQLSSQLEFSRAINQPAWIIQLWEKYLRELQAALAENRGRTGPLPACRESLDRLPATATNGSILAYTKPMLILIDEFSASFGDYTAAVLQDAMRGPLFGWRTNGAGGLVSGQPNGHFSEAFATYTIALGVRNRFVGSDEFGTTNYLENIGVPPDIPFDYMTRANLLSGGRVFTDAFTAAIVAEIGGAR
jgi:hypothetical protein